MKIHRCVSHSQIYTLTHSHTCTPFSHAFSHISHTATPSHTHADIIHTLPYPIPIDTIKYTLMQTPPTSHTNTFTHVPYTHPFMCTFSHTPLHTSLHAHNPHTHAHPHTYTPCTYIPHMHILNIAAHTSLNTCLHIHNLPTHTFTHAHILIHYIHTHPHT